ncbi:YvrJ family protein [Anaerococcus sp. AGMB00486]|uniref:YvrJ family protein n=2 Tax=Anaerococcus TaxID=165779 RepID=A0ABX2NBH0_9FIRM|nr:YvrJ family protein [Anaerococcus porci]NVF11817.1 YvrJ family protein [Anaerococcus faecalis]
MYMDIVEIITNLGFPIVVSLILITSLDKKVDCLIVKVNELIAKIDKKEK